ncbi:MAG: AI-2E family transporter, partial [Proteobacteria bacterium]|nr:AI-2E family transporter [Pseudomonadota bacterium]
MPETPADANLDIARFLRRLQWGLVTFAVLWLVWLLGAVLTPFVLAALLGWLGDPLVDRLERTGRSRPVAVTLVFVLMTLVLVLAVLILVPMVERQVRTLVEALPQYREWFIGTALPWVEARTGIEITAWLDPQRLIELVRMHWEQAGGVAATLFGYLSSSGFAFLAWVANIVLLPILTFYFLRDWDVMVD